MVVCLNKNSFCRHLHATPFCTKTNLRENRLFAVGWKIVREKGTHKVKIYAEKTDKNRWAVKNKTCKQRFAVCEKLCLQVGCNFLSL